MLVRTRQWIRQTLFCLKIRIIVTDHFYKHNETLQENLINHKLFRTVRLCP